jgi:elongation factor Ts
MSEQAKPVVTSELVKELRDRTNIPMMKCKQALDATIADAGKGKEGWLGAAIDWLRKQGVAAADKKADRTTANGGLGLATGNGEGVIVLLACETDFVSGNQMFKDFVKSLAETALSSKAADVEALKKASLDGTAVSEHIAGKIQQLGENLQLAKIVRLSGPVVVGYNHGGRIATLVAGSGDAAKLRQVALHVASAQPPPVALSRDQVDQAVIKKEEEILMATPDVQAKPEAMRGKIVQGKLGRFFKENVLLEQEMLLDAEKGETVEKYSARNKISVSAFTRIVV